VIKVKVKKRKKVCCRFLNMSMLALCQYSSIIRSRSHR